jgi:hypothetical protein
VRFRVNEATGIYFFAVNQDGPLGTGPGPARALTLLSRLGVELLDDTPGLLDSRDQALPILLGELGDPRPGRAGD